MEGKKVKYIAALLLALALLAVPGLAFVPTIPITAIEGIKETSQADSGSYTFTRVAVDAGETNTQTYTPQYVYSGMLFGADEADKSIASPEDDAYTAGVLANLIKTRAAYGTELIANPEYDSVTNPNVPRTIEVPADGVGTDTTRQYIYQGGNIYLTTTPIGSDAENEVDWSVDMGFSKTNLAWMSSTMDQFTVDAESQGVVGGNFLQAVPVELSPVCQNAWLIERECEPESITVAAWGDADLKEAYAGTKSTADLKLYPKDVDSAASAKMSGYAEEFAGYTDADVAGNSPANTQDPTDTWSDNEITMLLGNREIENFWITGDGVTFDAPECEDFPEMGDGTFGLITWPTVEPDV